MKSKATHDDLHNALTALREGKLILYPTDTIWGIGCDATSASAIDNVNILKGRPATKSLIILLENANNLNSFVKEVPEVAYELIEYSDNPITIVFSGAKNLPPNLVSNDGSIGIRIVKDDFCQELIRRFKKPIVSTSANLTGQPAPKNFSYIDESIINGVDYVVNHRRNDNSESLPSTIVKLGPSGEFEFIRKP